MSMYVFLSTCSHPRCFFHISIFIILALALWVCCAVLTSRCHCGTCQTFTSSAFSIGLVVPAESFELSDPSHLLKTYEDADPITMAGNRIAFCGKCGGGHGAEEQID